MKYLKIKDYLLIVFKEGTKWEYKEVIETKDNKTTPDMIKRFSLKKRFWLLSFSILSVLLLNTGFNSDFIGYTIAALSIFIGLFTSLVITMYQRFFTIPSDTEKEEIRSDAEKTDAIKLRNFIRQFTFVTGKNLLISTFIIFLATFSLLCDSWLQKGVFEYSPIIKCEQLSFSTISNGLLVSFLLLYRIAFIYLLFDFFILLLYSLGALFAFLKSEYSPN